LSCEHIRYYAYSVIKAQIPQVSRRADEDRFLHLIAFVVDAAIEKARKLEPDAAIHVERVRNVEGGGRDKWRRF
jgi:hypothetical protein